MPEAVTTPSASTRATLGLRWSAAIAESLNSPAKPRKTVP
jgi:hypothetical protein